MTNKEFCKIDTAFYGDEIDNIKQIGLRSFNGEELKEYVEAAINYTRCCKSDSEQLKCSGCKKPLHDGLCGSCCSSLASGMY
jgi:hypothetical protein